MIAPDQLRLDGLAALDTGVAVRRSSPLYGVHPYHTKIPVEAITTFIEANTQPGHVVLDPFCGSGMTGVAAGLLDRRAILSDLSPAAVHIATNYTQPCDPSEFLAAVQRILDRVGSRIADLYRTTHNGRTAQIEYLVWSDIRRCTLCGYDIVLWDARHGGLRILRCPRCGNEAPKSDLPVVGERAVQANLSQPGHGRIVRPVIDNDLRPQIRRADLPWYPDVPFDASRPMWRRGHHDLGIRSVADFYTDRNLTALSLLWDAASREPDERLRSALRFSLTAIANRASRRYQWNAKRPTNVLGGTLYISSLRYEWNVLSLWQRKTKAVSRMFAASLVAPDTVRVSQGSATALALPDNSVDYCFTDPPFGSHIVYSDASLLWEAWLDNLTDRDHEAIIVSGGDHPKTIHDYAGLLHDAFREVRRVLRPGALATVVFQSSDPDTWSAVYRAATTAGLTFVEATTLSKGQPSFKQVKGRIANEMVAEADVVLTFGREVSFPQPPRRISPEDAVRAASRAAKAVGRPVTPGALLADVNARLLRAASSPIGIRDVRAILERV